MRLGERMLLPPPPIEVSRAPSKAASEHLLASSRGCPMPEAKRRSRLDPAGARRVSVTSAQGGAREKMIAYPRLWLRTGVPVLGQNEIKWRPQERLIGCPSPS